MVSKATFVYIVMLSVFGAGLWAILSFGSILLRAPEDLAGRWELTDTKPRTGDAAPAAPATKLEVEQSGLFFNVSLDGGQRVAMKCAREETITLTGLDRKAIRLVSGDRATTMIWNGIAGSDEFEVRVIGSKAENWIAHRTERAHPKPRRARGVAASQAPTTRPIINPPDLPHAR